MNNFAIRFPLVSLSLLMFAATPNLASAASLDGIWAGKISCHKYTLEDRRIQSRIVLGSGIEFPVELHFKGSEISKQSGMPTPDSTVTISTADKLVQIQTRHSKMGKLSLEGTLANVTPPTIHFFGDAADGRICDFYLDLKK